MRLCVQIEEVQKFEILYQDITLIVQENKDWLSWTEVVLQTKILNAKRNEKNIIFEQNQIT